MSDLRNRLQRFDSDTATLDELVELSAASRNIRTEYENLQIDVPTWLTDATTRIRRTVATKIADDLDKRISEARSRRETLKTAEEKRQALDAELAKLEEAKKSLTVV